MIRSFHFIMGNNNRIFSSSKKATKPVDCGLDWVFDGDILMDSKSKKICTHTKCWLFSFIWIYIRAQMHFECCTFVSLSFSISLSLSFSLSLPSTNVDFITYNIDIGLYVELKFHQSIPSKCMHIWRKPFPFQIRYLFDSLPPVFSYVCCADIEPFRCDALSLIEYTYWIYWIPLEFLSFHYYYYHWKLWKWKYSAVCIIHFV